MVFQWLEQTWISVNPKQQLLVSYWEYAIVIVEREFKK
jgi:hypothetical protein